MDFDWPLADMSKVRPRWKAEVESGIRRLGYHDLFELGLPYAVTFSAKVIVYVIVVRTPQEIRDFFQGSTHLTDILRIKKNIVNHPDQDQKILSSLVERYYSDYIRSKAEQLQ